MVLTAHAAVRPDSSIRWNAYPAAHAALCLATGIALAEAFPGLSPEAWLLAFPLVLAGLLPLRRARRRLVSLTRLGLYLAAATSFVALGGLLHAMQAVHPPHHIAHLVGTPSPRVTLEGYVSDRPVSSTYGSRFLLGMDRRWTSGGAIPATGRVQVNLPPDLAPPPEGSRIRVQGRLEHLPRPRNPADFDYGTYLRRQGVSALLDVETTGEITVLAAKPGGLSGWLVAARAYVRATLDRHVPGVQPRAMMQALLLGDRRDLDRNLRANFASTGLMHVLAVSGLHVLLVGFVVFDLLRPLLMRRIGSRWSWLTIEYTRSFVTLTLLVLYLGLTGAPPSAVRAVLMAALFLTANLLQRHSPSLNTLGVAALVMLLLDPMQLFDVGFQLSFAAVAGIVSLRPVLASGLPSSWGEHPLARRLVTLVMVSLAATLATMPLLLHHFGQASLAGLLLNVAAIPLTALTLMAGMLLVVLGWWPAAGWLLGGAAGGFAGLLATVARAGARHLDVLTIEHYLDDPWLLAAMASALVMLAQWPRPRNRWRLAILATACLGGALWTHALTPPRLEVLFFDVGQGDAALIATPDGRHALIDAGERNAYTDRGRTTLVPHLRRFGIRHLDAVCITHPHSDHLGGVPYVLRHVPVGRVLDNGDLHGSALYDETQRLLDSLAIPHHALRAGDTLHLGRSVLVQVLSPPAPPEEDDDTNDASLVLRVVYGTTTFLFMGDAEASTEERLVAHYGSLLATDVVKVGHHGSATSSTPGFVMTAMPDTLRRRIAVVTAGRNNRFGFPDPDVVARWKDRGAIVWVTGRQRALWLQSDGTTVRRLAW
ncbi:MAG: DNA internalization-related competence protein ComEC/Rec2 [Rhodothermaceae bacterium]|nr:MAG: DNA internalization-related competence protein ComEC/Rec2 [Rhodothermaceae bacterium]